MIRRILTSIDKTTVDWFDHIALVIRQHVCKHEGTVTGRMVWEEEFAYAYEQCIACGKEWWPDD